MDSTNGFQTKVWGAPLWMCLHMMSLNYKPTSQMKHGYRMFFEGLAYALPCGACRDNYKENIRNVLPLNEKVFRCRESMSMWVFLLHNQVQRDIFAKSGIRQDKPKYNDTMTDFKKAMAFYERFRALCVKNSYGCTTPLRGSRKRSRIRIVKYTKPRRTNAIKNED